MYPKLISIVLLMIFYQTIHSQNELIDSTMYTVEELQEDFIFFRELLENHHPILYQHNSPERFKEYFDSLYARIDRPMNGGDFFRLIASSTLFIKCAHSQIQANEQINSNIMSSEYLIPIDIRYYDNKSFVSFNYTSSDELKEGTEILSINGKSSAEMYVAALSLLPRDGYSMGFPKHWVNRQFYYYYHLLYGMDKKYEIKYLKEGIETTRTFNGMSVAVMDSIIESRPDNKLDKPEGVTFYFIDSIRTAYIHIGSFSVGDTKSHNGKKFNKYIAKVFESIDSSGYENLILDLQRNGGGSPNNARLLCQYIMDQPFVFKTDIRKIKNKNESSFEKRSTSTLFSDGNRGEFKPKKNSFKGELYFLMDGCVNSASSEVASVVRRYNRGIRIGEESGGSGYLLTSRWFYVGKYQLPNTKLRYSAPKRTSVMGDYKEDVGRGEFPDVVVKPTIEDYIAQRDVVLLKAVELIYQKQQTN